MANLPQITIYYSNSSIVSLYHTYKDMEQLAQNQNIGWLVLKHNDDRRLVSDYGLSYNLGSVNNIQDMENTYQGQIAYNRRLGKRLSVIFILGAQRFNEEISTFVSRLREERIVVIIEAHMQSAPSEQFKTMKELDDLSHSVVTYLGNIDSDIQGLYNICYPENRERNNSPNTTVEQPEITRIIKHYKGR